MAAGLATQYLRHCGDAVVNSFFHMNSVRTWRSGMGVGLRAASDGARELPTGTTLTHLDSIVTNIKTGLFNKILRPQCFSCTRVRVASARCRVFYSRTPRSAVQKESAGVRFSVHLFCSSTGANAISVVVENK